MVRDSDRPALHVGLIGDYDPAVTAHGAILSSLHAASAGGRYRPFVLSWIATPAVSLSVLRSLDGIWCVPASPYRDPEGAFAAIRFARERGVPFLGTCGGFQHAVLEYARDVLGHRDVGHREDDPDTEQPLIETLGCSLVETQGRIRLLEGSQVRRIVGRPEIEETYHCRFGFNPRFESLFSGSELRISGRDAADDAPRAVELSGHPFFVGVQFQPERLGLAGALHPLVAAFCDAVDAA